MRITFSRRAYRKFSRKQISKLLRKGFIIQVTL